MINQEFNYRDRLVGFWRRIYYVGEGSEGNGSNGKLNVVIVEATGKNMGYRGRSSEVRRNA